MTATKFIEIMQEKFPNIYDVYDESTVLYALLKVYAERAKKSTDIIDRIYTMIGIDTTLDEDLERRWGSLLNTKKFPQESFTEYRGRLMVVYLSLDGGTARAIKYAIASIIRYDDVELIDKYIHIYDAWEYNGSYQIPGVVTEEDKYGHIICTISLSLEHDNQQYYKDVLNVINSTKASGISAHPVFILILEDSGILSAEDNIRFENIAFKVTQDLCILNALDSSVININMNSVSDDGSINYNITNSPSQFNGTNVFDSKLNINLKTNVRQEVDSYKDIITTI